MKKIVALLVAMLFVLSVSSISFAYPQAEKSMPKAEEKKAEPAKAKVKQITGEVAAVDTTAKILTVKGKKAEIVISADEKMLADVKVGDKVTVKYTEQDGKNVAKSIKKAAAEKKVEKKAEEKAAPKPAEKEMKK